MIHRLLGVAALLLVAHPSVLADEAKDLVGKYKCTFASDGFKYPPFPCVISKTATGLRLEKTAGSQRIRGEAQPTATGFHFSGEFYCPWGACDKKVEGDFTRLKNGEYEGTLQPDGTVVHLRRGK